MVNYQNKKNPILELFGATLTRSSFFPPISCVRETTRKLETVSPWNLNKEAWSCSIRLAPPPLFINVSLQCHYVYRTPMPASIYGDLGTVLWDLRGPIMSLSHYELGRKKIIAIIGVRLATTPIFAFLPPRLSGWAACPPLFICHNTPASKLEVSKAKLFSLKCTFFLFYYYFPTLFLRRARVTYPRVRICRPAQFSRGHPRVHHGLCSGDRIQEAA